MATTGVQQTEIDLEARFCSVIIVGNGMFAIFPVYEVVVDLWSNTVAIEFVEPTTWFGHLLYYTFSYHLMERV